SYRRVSSHSVSALSRFFVFFECAGALRDLPSFPTRRSSDLLLDDRGQHQRLLGGGQRQAGGAAGPRALQRGVHRVVGAAQQVEVDRKSTRLNSSHVKISYAVFCLKKKKKTSGKYNDT